MLTFRAKVHKVILKSPIWIQRIANILIAIFVTKYIADIAGFIGVYKGIFLTLSVLTIFLILELITQKIYNIKTR